MGLKNEAHKDNHRVESVLRLLNNQSPLTLKQVKFCNHACVERFLKAKADNVKKAAKHLTTSLSWRHSFGVDHLMADEFSSELAEGMAYVAGNDHQLRPVIIFRVKQDYQKFHSQKLFTRLLVFTLEVAIQSMAKSVEQFVLLFDGLFRSTAPFMKMLIGTLKIIGDHYPGRLHKACVIDPPSTFHCVWKGVRGLVELSSTVMVVSSLQFEELYSSSRKVGCSSSRFAFTVSHHFDSVKPWYLSLQESKYSEGEGEGRSVNTPKPWFLQSPAWFFRKETTSTSSESFGPFLKLYQRPYDEMIYRSKMKPPLGGGGISISQRF